MRLSREELKSLMKNKLIQAGLREDHADQTAEILTWAHERGFASHGAVRVEYYCERIFKGGITHEPNITWNQTGPCSGIMDGDNGIGYWVATKATEKAIEMAKENGVAIVGMANVSHTGAIGYYTEMCAKEGLAAITFCQSDPMAVPYGGTEPYYGTNPISFACPTADDRNVVFDMATTVQAWGKILDKRSQGAEIPAKGYGLMMMVDIFSGVLLGVPFGKHVSSMYHDCSKGRELGQTIIVIDPERFCGAEQFKKNMSQTCDELNAMRPAPGFDKVYYPGQRALMRRDKAYAEGGIEVVDELVDYLKSDAIHFDRYDHKNRFAD